MKRFFMVVVGMAMFSLCFAQLNAHLPDRTFGNEGVTTPMLPGWEGEQHHFLDVIIQPDQSVLLLGHSQAPLSEVTVMSRLTPDGALDSDFGDKGFMSKFISGAGGGFSIPNSFSSMPNGLTMVTVSTMMNPFGEPGMGLITVDKKGNVINQQLYNRIINSTGHVVTDSGNVIVAGSQWARSKDMATTSILYDGWLDTTYGDSAQLLVDVSQKVLNDVPWDITRNEAGRIIIAGDANNRSALLMLNPNGYVDSSFGDSGIVHHDLSGLSLKNQFHKVRFMPDGSMVALGAVQDHDSLFLSKFDSTGKLLTNFGINGNSQTSLFTEFSSDANNALEVDGNGRIWVAGYLQDGAETDMGIQRFLSNGQRDSSFNKGEVVRIKPSSTGRDKCKALAFDAVGHVYLVGSTHIGSDEYFAVVRLLGEVPLGVDNSIAAQQLKVWPNPATNSLNVQTMTSPFGGKIRLLNTMGSLFYESEIHAGVSTIHLPETLVTGNYLLQYITTDGFQNIPITIID